MTREEAKSCISTIEMLQRLAYNIHGVMDVIDADNCEKIIKALEQNESAEEWYKLFVEKLEQDAKAEQFAKWVANEIFDEMWEYNYDAFAELACRKLAKLGIVRAIGDEWELVEPQESEDNR